MLRTVLEMTVRAGCEEEFRAVWRETARSTARRPGSVAQTLLRDPRSPRNHVIMADWADREALDTFRASPERRELSSRLDEFRDSAAQRVLETVEHIPARPAHDPAQER